MPKWHDVFFWPCADPIRGPFAPKVSTLPLSHGVSHLQASLWLRIMVASYWSTYVIASSHNYCIQETVSSVQFSWFDKVNRSKGMANNKLVNNIPRGKKYCYLTIHTYLAFQWELYIQDQGNKQIFFVHFQVFIFFVQFNIFTRIFKKSLHLIITSIYMLFRTTYPESKYYKTSHTN